MTTTTSYGNWHTADPGHVTLEDSVAAALAGWEGDYDIAGLCQAYRDAINEQLPEGVTLNGNEFYDPVDRHGNRSVAVDISACVDGVGEGFWDLAAQYDLTTAA